MPDALVVPSLPSTGLGVRLGDRRRGAVRWSVPSHSLSDRIAAHVAAARRGGFLGDCGIRNPPRLERCLANGCLAATAHLFDLARQAGPKELAAALRALVGEVDARAE